MLYIHRYNNVLSFIPVIKDGVAAERDLQLLSSKLVECWKDLARCLGLEESDITAIEDQNWKSRERALKVCLRWRANCGTEATYRVLYDALCDELVGQTELAQKYCCFES